MLAYITSYWMAFVNNSYTCISISSLSYVSSLYSQSYIRGKGEFKEYLQMSCLLVYTLSVVYTGLFLVAVD